MRDNRFIAENRGGPLKKEQHWQLIKWASNCAEHVLPLYGEKVDKRLLDALFIANEWAIGKAKVGEARGASLNAIAVANESSNPVTVAVARAVGHAVATAHMADHSIRAASYALKAVKLADKPVDEEREWQISQLAEDIREIVRDAIGNS
jgi:hypothetical protein